MVKALRGLLLISCMLSGTAAAVEIPHEYLIGSAPQLGSTPPHEPAKKVTPAERREKSASVPGVDRTVVAPITTGSAGGNLSFLRLHNFEGHISPITVRVVGFPSAVLRGEVVYNVPPGASPQYSISEILEDATGSPSKNPADVGVTLYIGSPDIYVAYQHVILNLENSFLENMTMCNETSVSDYQIHTPNVHTTSLSAFPSYIMLHNYSVSPREYPIDVRESSQGRKGLKGRAVLTALPNTTYLVPFSYIQSLIGWTPTAAEAHANIFWDYHPGTESFYGVIGHMVYNNALKTYTNMTQFCSIKGI
jgi:hypothetical protein